VDCGGYCYPCDSDLPEFSVSMGDYLLEIPTDILTYAQVNETYCYGSVQNNLDVGGQSLGLQVFGDPVFRSAFVVFENSADL
jgi:aspergillopepsin I